MDTSHTRANPMKEIEAIVIAQKTIKLSLQRSARNKRHGKPFERSCFAAPQKRNNTRDLEGCQYFALVLETLVPVVGFGDDCARIDDDSGQFEDHVAFGFEF